MHKKQFLSITGKVSCLSKSTLQDNVIVPTHFPLISNQYTLYFILSFPEGLFYSSLPVISQTSTNIRYK